MELPLRLSQVTLSLSSLISLGYHKYLLMFNDLFLIHLHSASVPSFVKQVLSELSLKLNSLS